MPASILARLAAIFLCAVFAVLCLAKARLIGDGLEYLAMVQGFVAHGSPELRRTDVDAFAAMPPPALARALLKPAMLDGAIERLERGAIVELGFARARDGSVHAIHFWMYSLLAAPFYALVVLLGQNPFMALVALNLAILAASAWRVRAWLPAAGLPELALVAIMGPLYYTVWSGPEVMAGCCVLLASLAALRRDLALTVALAGLGASQNPSIAGLIPAAAAYAALYRWFPAAALFPPEGGPRPWLRDGALVAAGIAAALLPYLHNMALFGMPSLISHYYTDLGLVTPERMFSFLFDLNQGLFTGFPALPACAAIILAALEPGRRRAWLVHLGIALLLTLGMALPTLAATNWNSGAIIVSRYAYWTSMPMLAVCLVGLVQLGPRTRNIALCAALLLQALFTWQAYRSRAPSFISHGRLAAWVLDHAPRWYNPDPEIFLKRERRREDLVTPDQVVVHRGPRGATKLMRYWSNSADSGGLCGPGTHLAAAHVKTLASGWRYYNAPLRCDPGPAPAVRIAIGPGMPPILGSGWSRIEGAMVWTEGEHSRLRLALPPGRRAAYLGLDGAYFDGVRASTVTVNGVELGKKLLGQAPLALPAQVRGARVLDVTIEHALPARPADAADPRALGFSLRGVAIEFELETEAK
ncbi:hypothetical protein [Massilia yuzhufengensis]|uniref:Uncharacterized protein n=1 Tax=Massilia yuzhufengensis TaxID=1164594 RepID=A0A1I1M0H8_9BURK|nr:hypothetical protein [Massilia yuzhufengensis]SFC78606.1 hypothetical protein SAMN05216204_11063 [Massilia yuzhufengensis]